ncbi:hypothetical protein Tco_1335617 [Tanacetum coccineum]
MLDYGFNFMNTKIHIDNESTIYIVKNLVFHSKTKHIEIRHHFIRDSYEKKLIQVIKIHTDHNVIDLLTKAFDVNETVYKEWEDIIERAATTASSLEAEQDSGNINRTQSMITLNESFPQGSDLGSGPRCQDTILRGAEAQIRFDSASKQSNNPPLLRVNTLGSEEDNMKLKELMELCTKLSERILDNKKNRKSKLAKTVNGEREIQALVDKKKVIISKTSIKSDLKLDDAEGTNCLPTATIIAELERLGNMKRASKGYTGVDTPLFQTMLVQGQILQGDGSTIPVESHHTPISAPSTSQPPTSPPSMQTTHVAKEVATMPHDLPLLRGYSLRSDKGKVGGSKVKSSKARRRVRLVVSEDEDKLEDSSKQGRKIAQIDEDKGITLVHMSAQTQGRHEHDFEESNFDFIAPEEDYTAELDISTDNVPVSTASAEVSTANPEVKTAVESLVYIRRSAAKRKDKGKAIMKEAEPVQKKTKLQLEQERLGLKEALRMQEQLDEEERKMIARVHEEASTFNAEEWNNIQAQIKADEKKREFAQQRAEQRRNKPMTQAQQRTYMFQGDYLRPHMKRVNTFTPIESDDTVPKVVARSSKIDAEQELNQENSKRQKIGEGSEPAEESKYEQSQEQLQ